MPIAVDGNLLNPQAEAKRVLPIALAPPPRTQDWRLPRGKISSIPRADAALFEACAKVK